MTPNEIGRKILSRDKSNLLRIMEYNAHSSKNVSRRVENDLGNMLKHIYVKSTFKDIGRTSLALGVNKAIALQWIIEFCLDPKLAGNHS